MFLKFFFLVFTSLNLLSVNVKKTTNFMIFRIVGKQPRIVGEIFFNDSAFQVRALFGLHFCCS